MNIKILYEDKNIIVALKCPNLPSQPDKTGDKDMLTLMKEYSSIENIGLINRLDRPVGGVMLFSKNKKYNSILSKYMIENKIQKTYLAVVYGKSLKKAYLNDFMVKNSRLNISTIVDKSVKGSKEAILYYDRIGFKNESSLGDVSLLKINIQTGRHHQIRLQLSNSGFPIVGDFKYNKNPNINDKINIALFSAGLRFKLYDEIDEFNFFEIPSGYPFDIFEYKPNN